MIHENLQTVRNSPNRFSVDLRFSQFQPEYLCTLTTDDAAIFSEIGNNYGLYTLGLLTTHRSMINHVFS